MFPERDPEDAATDRLAVIILAVGLCVCIPAAGYLDFSRRAAARAVQEAGEGEELKQEGAVVDTGPDAGTAGRRVVPEAPAPWQKVPPCDKKQHAINGACYYRANPEDFKPPCEAPTVEWKGACYHAVARVQRPPTSGPQ